MQTVSTGESYISKNLDIEVSVNNVTRKGRGFQITYTTKSGKAFGLITSRAEFLKAFKLITNK